ncbi:MAG: nucleoside/nucleotide kinase family protein [Limimaricola sp.]|nr:nucleoside/nucleotide kinase family protein [Limimaricola sp.]
MEQALAGRDRLIVAIAGAPGSGKSTLSHMLADHLSEPTNDAKRAIVVPMDGFHFDDIVLREQGTIERKGAPYTFDTGGLRACLERLRENREPEIAVPVFDRDIEIARAGARLIPQTCKIVLVEGNYLLLDEPPWHDLQQIYDVTFMIRVPFDTLEARLVKRWIDKGLSRPAATNRARDNDLVNARRVIEASGHADIVVG